jgi:hypothetical protein
VTVHTTPAVDPATIGDRPSPYVGVVVLGGIVGVAWVSRPYGVGAVAFGVSW